MRRKVLAWAIVVAAVAAGILIPKAINHGKNYIEDTQKFACSESLAMRAAADGDSDEENAIHNAEEAKIRSINYWLATIGKDYNGERTDVADIVMDRSFDVAYDAENDVWRVIDQSRRNLGCFPATYYKLTVYMRGNDGLVLEKSTG